MGFAALAAFVPAQGCGAGIAECTLDADCDQGQACELSECVPVCDSDADCSDDEVCLKGLTTERRVCQTVGGNNATTVRSTFAIVRDATDGEGCLSADPGSDISFVLLENIDGSVAAWGRVVKASITTEMNDYATWAHLDGDAPEWGADSCPTFEKDHVVALGCGGYIGVEFLDTDQNSVSLRSGEHKLRVGEYGSQCEGGNDLDRYEVLLCPEVESADGLPDACSISIGLGQGERAFEF